MHNNAALRFNVLVSSLRCRLNVSLCFSPLQEGLVAFEASGNGKLRSQFVRALMSISGVLLGTLGIAAALRFVSRRL